MFQSYIYFTFPTTSPSSFDQRKPLQRRQNIFKVLIKEQLWFALGDFEVTESSWEKPISFLRRQEEKTVLEEKHWLETKQLQ